MQHALHSSTVDCVLLKLCLGGSSTYVTWRRRLLMRSNSDLVTNMIVFTDCRNKWECSFPISFNHRIFELDLILSFSKTLHNTQMKKQWRACTTNKVEVAFSFTNRKKGSLESKLRCCTWDMLATTSLVASQEQRLRRTYFYLNLEKVMLLQICTFSHIVEHSRTEECHHTMLASLYWVGILLRLEYEMYAVLESPCHCGLYCESLMRQREIQETHRFFSKPFSKVCEAAISQALLYQKYGIISFKLPCP